MTDQEDDRFFNKQFWRMTLIAAFSQMIVLVIAITASMIFGSKIDSLTTLFATANETLARVETSINTVMGVDPAELQEKANALRDGATEVGTGVGDGGAEVVDRVGDAWKKFRQGDE